MIIYGNQTPNREGKPYKLVLAVWQGGGTGGAPRVVWVGGVERLEGALHPEAYGISDDMTGQPRTSAIDDSSGRDSVALSSQFIIYVQRGI